MEEELLITLSVSYWLKKDLPVLEVGKLGLSTDTSELYVGTTSGNLKIQDVPEFIAPEPPVVEPVANVKNLSVVDNQLGTQISLEWSRVISSESISYDIEVDGVLYESTANTYVKIFNLVKDTNYVITVKTKAGERLSSGVSVSVKTVSPIVEEPEPPIEEPEPPVDPPVEEPVSSVIIKDSFNRPNSSSLGIADSGQAWRQYDTMSPAGTYEIVGNKAVMTNAGAHHSRTYAYIDAGVSNLSLKTTFSPAERASIMIRGKKQSSPVEFIRLRGETSGYYELSHYIGGTSSGAASITNVLATSTRRKADGDQIEIVANGQNIKVYINGQLDIDVNSNALINETIVGFNGGGGALVYFDSFEVNSLGSTPPVDEPPVEEEPEPNPDGAPVDKGIVGNNEPVYVWVGGVE